MGIERQHQALITPELSSLLTAHGLEAGPLLHAAHKGGVGEILKVLGDIVEGRYQGKEGVPPKSVLGKFQSAIDDSLRCIARSLVSRDGVSIPVDAPVHAGGFSWVLRVSYQGRACALVLPKMTGGDYDEKIAVRAEVGRLLPESGLYSIPKLIRFVKSSVPCCLMTYATGENCYQRTFDADGKPHSAGVGPAAGIEVFRKLGEIAAGFSSIKGERFGAPLKPEYNSAEQYIKAHTDEIEHGILSSDSLDLRKYGITLSQLRKILDWVKKDAATQTGSYLRHGDLSPWNLLHDTSANQWTIVDGDDAKFGVLGEQIGVCLNSMRGNFNRDWIDALLDGYGARGEAQRREVLLRGAAYGTVTYGLTNAGRPWDPTNAEMCRDVAFSYMAPCVLLFEELT